MPRQDTHRPAQSAPTAAPAPTTNEVAELRNKVAALEIAVERLLAERDGQHVDGNGGAPIDTEAAQREAPVADGVSRRRLFGLLGGAAAAGAGLAVVGSTLGADRADAADGGNMIIGQINTNDNPGGGTSLTGSTAANGIMFDVTNTASQGDGVLGLSDSGAGVSGSSTSGTGVVGSSTSGVGVNGGSGSADGVHGASTSGTGVFATSGSGNSLEAFAPSSQSPGAHLRLIPGDVTGPPTGGAHRLGQLWLDSAGKLWQCVVAGTPGTWVDLTSGSKLVAVNPPARVLDTRSSGGPISSGQTRAVTVAGLLGVPAGVSAVLTNLTATGANAAGFLAMVAHGAPPPSTSNLNLIPNQDLANNATSAVASNQVDVSCGGPVSAVNFIVDVFGYYP